MKGPEFAHMDYATWVQTIEKPRLDAIPDAVKDANHASHSFGAVDDCVRCVFCEVGIWNGWKAACDA